MRHDGFMEDVDFVGEPPGPPSAGSLLVAAPLLPDPFRHAVIMLLEHDDSGTLGVVLNQRTQVDVGTVLPAWRDHLTGGPHLFQGGPVSLDTALGLAAADGEPDGFRRVAGSLGVIDLDTPVDVLAPQLAAVRIYAGYAGWSPGQLDTELEEGAWAVIEPTDPVSDAFLADPDDLWQVTLLRAGGTLAWWVNCPDDPSVN
jgi:putative transcriptional regulator